MGCYGQSGLADLAQKQNHVLRPDWQKYASVTMNGAVAQANLSFLWVY